MWKKLKSRGAETVEYAIVLACIAAFGFMFSDNLTQTLETLMGKTGSIITNGSTNNGNQEDDDDNNNQEDEKDKNLAWIEKLMQASKEQKFGDTLNASINKRNDPNFKDNTGLIDSEANSDFVKFMENTLKTGETIPGCSWVFAGYTKDGQKYYNVSIYTPAKNGGTSLADVQPGTSIKTDVYKVNAKTGEVTKITDYPNQQVIVRTNGNKSYNVIRDSDNK